MDSKVDKHSAGPWYPGHLGDSTIDCQCTSIVNEGYAGGIARVNLDNGLKYIESGWNDCPPLEEAVANMHLIAASPDMLESLDYVWGEFDNLEGFFEDRDSEGFWETLSCLKTNLRWVRKKARNEPT